MTSAASISLMPGEIEARLDEILAPLGRLGGFNASRVGETALPGAGGAGDPTAGASRLDAALEAVRSQVGRILHEHQGMANELLRVYEYMGVVFDLTPRMLALRCEDEVISLLVENLRSIFNDARLAVVRHAGQGEDSEGRGGGNARRSRVKADTGDGSAGGVSTRAVSGDFDFVPDWMYAAVNDSHRERRVRVISESHDPEATLDRQLLAADQALTVPIFAGSDLVCQVVLWRRAGSHGWESGDMLLLDSLSTFCGDVIRNFRLLRELQDMSMETVRTLVNAVDQKDAYTSGHSNRVGYYATLLAREMGFDCEQLRVLEWSALLHDVGKIGIREAVLNKPGKLTDEEFEHIKEHPLRGYEVVRENPHMREAVDGVLYHHERFDGRGYPKGLKGEAIPLQARVIQIADIFDALTTTRSYRGAYSWREALDILKKESGTVVDPSLCATFVGILERLFLVNPEAFEEIGRPVSRLHLEEGRKGRRDEAT